MVETELTKFEFNPSNTSFLFKGYVKFDGWLDVKFVVYVRKSTVDLKPMLCLRLGEATKGKDGKFHNPVHVDCDCEQFLELENQIINYGTEFLKKENVSLDEIFENFKKGKK
jgi:hypothetical protein